MGSPQEKLQEFKQLTLKCISTNVVGIYVHGSVAMNSFNPISSDIDILVVVSEPLTEQEKKSYLEELISFSKDLHLGKGLEMSIVLERSVEKFVYPTTYEFHFGYDKLEKYKDGFIDDGKSGPDPDLAAHFVTTKTRGICLYGEPIEHLFPDVPLKYYLQSISEDAEWSFDNISKGLSEGFGSVPTYAVLNYCRVLAFINQGLVTSKQEGGEWGIGNLPSQYNSLIQEALKEYAKSGSSKEIDLRLLKEFNVFAIEKIREANEKMVITQEENRTDSHLN